MRSDASVAGKVKMLGSQRLADEAAADLLIRKIWTSADTAPFLAQIDIPQEMVDRISTLIRVSVFHGIHRCESAFELFPYASCWLVLHTLAKTYGGESNDVYPHLEQALGLDLSPPNRARFKAAFHTACRKIGIRVPDPANPTGLFFSNVGVVDAQAGKLATCLLKGAQRFGSPPLEDLGELRQWQRRSTAEGLEGYTRATAALRNDATAWYAGLFCDWRSGAEPRNQASKHLFAEFARVADHLGIDQSSLVAPPRLLWTEYGLGLIASPSKYIQIITIDGLPSRLNPERPWHLPSPWAASLKWTCGTSKAEIQVLPEPNEILVFALDTQRLVMRAAADATSIAVPTAQILLMAGSAFAATDASGDVHSVPQGQAHVSVLDVPMDGAIAVMNGRQIELSRDRLPGMRMQGPVIGRSGTIPLYTSSARILISTGNETEETGRVLRIRIGAETWFVSDVSFDAAGQAVLDLATLGFNRRRDPCAVDIALLIKGAGAKADARAEIRSRFFVWPDTADMDVQTPFRVDHVPGNFLSNTSEHLHVEGAGMWIEGSGGYRFATLSLLIDGARRDFAIPFRGTQIFRNDIAQGTSSPIMQRSIVTLGYNNRQDTLTIRSTEMYADLYVRGTIIRRPFIARTSWEIHASQLDPAAPTDDQIALVFDDGRRDLLCRITRPIEPHRITISEDTSDLHTIIVLPTPCDAICLSVFVEDQHGEAPEECYAQLGRHPLPGTQAPWLRAEILSADPQEVKIFIDRNHWRKRAGLGILSIREAGDPEFKSLQDSRGRPFALGLHAEDILPVNRHDRAVSGNLARMLTGTYQPDCDAQIRGALQSRFAGAVSAVAGRGLMSPLVPLSFVAPFTGMRGFIPRVDILAPNLAPDLFSSDPNAFSMLEGVAGAQALLGMVDVARMPAPKILRDHAGSDDLLARWLLDLDGFSATEIAPSINAGALRKAFFSFRQNARESDFMLALTQETVGQSLRLAVDVYVTDLEELLLFDEMAGSDRFGVKLAAYLSRFAKASRAGRATEFHLAIAKRTQLPVEHITPATSFALRVGCELFAYFLIFWTIALREAPIA